MAQRTTFSNLSTPPLPGGGPTGFAQQYAERFKQLFDNSAIKLTAVAGTANAVTATLDPLLDGGGLVDGMKFTLTFTAANTGGVTLAINGGAAVPVLDAGGAALIAGAVASGLRALIEYIGGNFRLLSALASAGAEVPRYHQVFTASGTWSKPAGLDPDTMVTVEGWGGGGGGSPTATYGGGGGGGYASKRFRIGDLPSSVAVTIGTGGAVGARGGDSSFGSLLFAYNGGASISTSQSGGGGGGELAQGQNSSGTGGQGGSVSGGDGGYASTPTPAQPGGHFGGGGGGYGIGSGIAGSGGNAVFGGGGGAGDGPTDGSPGASVHGGAGGAVGVAGSAPGGGGGRNAAGARGEIRVWI